MAYRLAVGSYTRPAGHVPNPRGDGISVLSWDPAGGVSDRVICARDMENPSWLHLDDRRNTLYSITETAERPGELCSWRLNTPAETAAEGAPRPIGCVPGPGRAGCHLAVSPDSDLICAASYLDGAIVGYALNTEGGIGPELFRHRYSGSGPNPARQESSHAHQVVFEPSGRWFYVTDLGADRVWKHPFDSPHAEPEIALVCPPGSGPRHMVVNPDGDTAYVVCELQPRIITVRIDPDSGTMSTVSDAATVPADRADAARPSAIKVHPSGRTLIVAHRFDDSITVFGLGHTIPGEVTRFPCRGKTPRDATFSPDGEWLFIANQDSHTIQCCRFDHETGMPANAWGTPIDLGSPSCVVML